MHLPRLYAIIDAGLLSAREIALRDYLKSLRDAGVTLVQYRDKDGLPQQVLQNAAVISETLAGTGCTLLMNDRTDLACLAHFDGVHVGQSDLSPEDARAVLGAGKTIGMSTHSDEQVAAAHVSCADYIAIGPVFATGTKPDAAAVVGLEGVRRARSLTTKPLVAIGGINWENAGRVIYAGADSVALVSGLLAPGEETTRIARTILHL